MEDRSAHFRIGQLATRTGVDPERLRKWESRYALLEPVRSQGGFRLYSLEDEQRVRLMQRHLARGYAAAEAAELAREGIVAPSPARLAGAVPPRTVDRAHGLLRIALTEYDEGAAERSLDDLFRAFTTEAVLRDAVLPFLHEVGAAWERGEVTVGQEHFASTIIQARLMSLTRGWGTGGGPRALLACPPCERHTLGLMAFGIAMSRRGWRITYLGAETPIDSLAAAIEAVRPRVVMVSASRVECYADFCGDLAQIAATSNLSIGGGGASAELANEIGAQYVAEDPVTAADRF